jgi:hypothetical protein
MLQNSNHDIVQQLSEISDSLWRIKNQYLSDADEDTKELWQQLADDYECHVELLTKEIVRRAKEDTFK